MDGLLERLITTTSATAADIATMKTAQARIESKIDQMGEQHASVVARVSTLEERNPPGTSQLIGASTGGGALVFLVDWAIRHIRF